MHPTLPEYLLSTPPHPPPPPPPPPPPASPPKNLHPHLHPVLIFFNRMVISHASIDSLDWLGNTENQTQGL